MSRTYFRLLKRNLIKLYLNQLRLEKGNKNIIYRLRTLYQNRGARLFKNESLTIKHKNLKRYIISRF
jgi:hypothetical protein